MPAPHSIQTYRIPKYVDTAMGPSRRKYRLQHQLAILEPGATGSCHTWCTQAAVELVEVGPRDAKHKAWALGQLAIQHKLE